MLGLYHWVVASFFFENWEFIIDKFSREHNEHTKISAAVNEDLKSTLGEETEVIEESIDTTPTTSTGSDTNTTSTVQTSTTSSSDNSNSTTVVTTTEAGTTKSADSSAQTVSVQTLSTLIVMTILSWAL